MRRRYLNERKIHNEFDLFDEVDGKNNLWILKKYIKHHNYCVIVEVYFDEIKREGNLVISLMNRCTIQHIMCDTEFARKISEFCSSICLTNDPNDLDIDTIEFIIGAK